MLKQPIFISGLRKSGTSMVKNLLDNHPALFMYPPNEFHFFKFTHFHNLGRKIASGLIHGNGQPMLTGMNSSILKNCIP
jgi:hypothetical protein